MWVVMVQKLCGNHVSGAYEQLVQQELYVFCLKHTSERFAVIIWGILVYWIDIIMLVIFQINIITSSVSKKI